MSITSPCSRRPALRGAALRFSARGDSVRYLYSILLARQQRLLSLFTADRLEAVLTPVGEHSAQLSLGGVYRPPLAALGADLDRAVFHKVADATVRSLLARVADVLGPPPEPAGAVQGTDRTGAAARRTAAEMP